MIGLNYFEKKGFDGTDKHDFPTELSAPTVFDNFVVDPNNVRSIVLPTSERVEFEPTPKPPERLADWLANVASYLNDSRNYGKFYELCIKEWEDMTKGTRRKRQAAVALNQIEEGDRILVYYDVMRSSLCSDFRGKLLRILSYEGKTGRQTLFPVYYYPVEKQVIDCIYVELKTKYDEYFPFPDSDQPVVIVLHFRAAA